MWLAEHLHYAGDLRKLMSRIPQKQFLMWMRRRQELLNTPSRSDHYLMALRYAVESILGKGDPSLKAYLVKFNTEQKAERMDGYHPDVFKTKEYIKYSKEMWMASTVHAGTRPGQQS